MGTVHNTLEGLLNEYDVARIVGLSVASVRRWRLVRKGPRYLKIGASVRYTREDIAAWLASRPTGGEPRHTETSGRDKGHAPAGAERHLEVG